MIRDLGMMNSGFGDSNQHTGHPVYVLVCLLNAAPALGGLRVQVLEVGPFFQSWLEGLHDPKLDLKNVLLFLIKSGYWPVFSTGNPPCKKNGNVLDMSCAGLVRPVQMRLRTGVPAHRCSSECVLTQTSPRHNE